MGHDPHKVIRFKNVNVIDGTGAAPCFGDVVVEDGKIKALEVRTDNNGGLTSDNELVINGNGRTVMPGLIDSHLHLSWNNAPTIEAIQNMPYEEHTLWAAKMAKLVLDAGFTSGMGAAAAKNRLDVVIRNAIDSGLIPGPRYRAAGPEITTVGGLGDTAPPHIQHDDLNLSIVVSGPEEVRHAVRKLIGIGVDNIKLNLSGEEITPMKAEETPMAEEEIAMAVKEARIRGKRVCAHARSSLSVQQCIRHGIEVIYHASFADEQTLDQLETVKDKHFVAPGLAWLIGTARNAEAYGIPPDSPLAQAYEREFQIAVNTMKEMHRRGIRILIGGDYGFAWTPQGTNARDLEYFVEYLGMTPLEAIRAGTQYGGQILGMEDSLGVIKPGYIADLLLVDGNPSVDVKVLQDQSKLHAIMQNGQFYKAPIA